MKSSSNRFRRIFWITAGVHGFVVLLLLSYSVIQRWFTRQPPREEITFVSLHTPAPPVEAVEAAEAAVEAPPEPPPPQPAPQPRVQRSTQRVRREPSPPPAPQLTPEQIRQQLEQAVPTGVRANSGAPDDLAWYYNIIHQTFMRAWNQPGSALAGATVTARIRVQRDGTITRRELLHRSGNTVMDESVSQALESVSRLSPLPAEIEGAHHDFTIEFELTGAGR